MGLPIACFDALTAALLLQRLHELRLSHQHLRALGPPDFGLARPEPALLAFHAAFFVLPLLEVHWRGDALPPGFFIGGLGVLIAAQVVRFATQRQLGPYWTVLPAAWRGQRLATGGLYRWCRHPNYVAVAFEVLAFPLAGAATLSAMLLVLLHPFVLARRIANESRALAALCADSRTC